VKEAELLSLADEIQATVKHEVAKLIGPLQARVAELGKAAASANAEVLELRARIEQVAKEPRVHIEPQFIVPVPAVHVSPVLHPPARKPMKRTLKPAAGGGYVIEDGEAT
jgi:hypothetical protein